MFWPMVFLLFGLFLVMLEVFIPSGGFIGISSIACLVLCLWYAYQQSVGLLAAFMLIDLVALPLTVSLAFSLWSRTPLGRKFFLKPPAPEEIGVSHTDHHLEELIGLVGRSLSPLRPSGHVEIGGRRVDALAEEGLIPADTQVLALRIRSGQLVVRGMLDSVQAPREEWHGGGDDSWPEKGPSPIATTTPSTAAAVSTFEDSP